MTCPSCGTKAIFRDSKQCEACYFRSQREAPLTPKQGLILQFILESYVQGWLPTQYEIGEAIGSGPTCPKQIKALENKGWLSRRGYRYQLTQKAIGKAMMAP